MSGPFRGDRFAWMLVALAGAWLAAAPAQADEGLWMLDRLPLDEIERRYGFRPAPDWIEHVQKASVDFRGGSGAFVSPDGLVLTNHHVALGQLHKLSGPGHDLVRDGFYAKSREDERPCPDLELRVLESTEDVTARVLAAIEPAASETERNDRRKAEIARIEAESDRETGFYSRVVELYHGGEYRLHRWKRYTDVRLVMAPEEQAAFFGGDPDNFSYPRHDLDVAFFRVWEDGHPLRPERWLRWSVEGASDGDLVFVAGHPGSTGRLRTVAQLEYLRDAYYPLRIALQERRLERLREYAVRGVEEARQVQDRLRGLENNLKRQREFLAILRDPVVMERKRAEEAAWRARIAADPGAAAECADAYERIEEVQREAAERHVVHALRAVDASRLAAIAHDILEYVVEVPKPNEERFAEYRDSNLAALRRRLFSPAPIWPGADAVALAAQLEDARERLGPDDPFVRAALGRREPAAVAVEVLTKTTLRDPEVRKRLVEGGPRAVERSRDPLVQWMRRLEPMLREQREWKEDRVEAVESLEGGRIARARFLLEGTEGYPDATGTLRLSYGRTAGYEQLTTVVPWKTTFYGLFDRAESFDGRPPFDLPPRVAAARGSIALDTPLDFVCTNDIIGGNSGSPVIDTDLRCVGVVFDGNAQSYRWNYVYDDDQARCVAVHSAGILEALRRIWGMDALADELAGESALPGRE